MEVLGKFGRQCPFGPASCPKAYVQLTFETGGRKVMGTVDGMFRLGKVAVKFVGSGRKKRFPVHVRKTLPISRTGQSRNEVYGKAIKRHQDQKAHKFDRMLHRAKIFNTAIS